jgi:hypothetical protein
MSPLCALMQEALHSSANNLTSAASHWDMDEPAWCMFCGPAGVDVINYSISGQGTRFGDAVSLAFKHAAQAGVFVSVAASNR